MAKIGFTADIPAIKEEIQRPEDCLFQTDSGVQLSALDLLHHLLVLGSTGSGKTQGLALPLLYAFMRMGYAGLIIDLKGNLRSLVRRLARACGHEHRIVEYGTGKLAQPLNLLENLTFHGYNAFFENLVKRHCNNQTGNLDFHLRGAKQAVDCAKLLYFLSESLEWIEPNLVVISQMLNSENLSQQLYKYFKEEIFNAENEEHAEFSQEVEGDCFHILYSPETDDNEFNTDRMRQIGYALQNVRDSIKQFTETPGFEEHFCAEGAPGLDMELALAQRKIILLRFDPDTGPGGEQMAREFVTSYYGAVYEIGMRLPFPTFTLLDEYQDIADLSNNRFADWRFASMAREFKASAVFLTQSLAALGAGTPEGGKVDSLVANCNTRIVFYSDDPATQGMVARYGSTDLTALEPQQAFMVRYDAEKRHHLTSLETFNDEYKTCQGILAQWQEEPEPPDREEKAPDRFTLKTILKKLEGKEREMTDTKPKEETAPPLEPGKAMREKLEAMTREFPEYFNPNTALGAYAVPQGWHSHLVASLKAVRETGLALEIAALTIDGVRLEARPAKRNQGLEGARFLNRLLVRTRSLCMACGASLNENEDDEYDFRLDSTGLCIKC